MNRATINSQAIGNGEPSFRVFLSMRMTAAAVTSAAIYGFRYMAATVIGRATTASRLDGMLRLAGAITARATSSITTAKYYAKYIASAITARSTSVITWFAWRALSASQSASAISTSVMYRGRILDSSVTAHAYVQGGILEITTGAPEDRQAILPYENRSVEVI